MSCAYLAIIGFPLFDGFYAKDPIIEAAFAAEGAEGWLLGSAALIGAGITAFYMTRLMIMTFFGEPRWKELKSADGRDYHPHESPLVMTVPMIILAVGSVGAGAFFAIGDRLANWLAPSVGPYEHPEPPFPAIVVTIATLAVVAVGVFIAYWFIGRRPVPVAAPEPVSAVVALARADVGGNAINETLFARPGIWLTRASVFADAKGIDGAVNGSGRRPGRAVRPMAALAERLRPVVCAVHVRRHPRRGADAAAGEGHMTRLTARIIYHLRGGSWTVCDWSDESVRVQPRSGS